MAHVVEHAIERDEEGKETSRSDLVAFVRLAKGGTVQLHSGDTVPAEADAEHVAALTERGVLAEVKEKGGRSGGQSGSGDPS